MNYCINVPFVWNQDSLDWIDLKLQYYVDEFYDKFPENGGNYLRKYDIRSKEFQQTAPVKQIANFLNSIEITNFYVHFIMYKKIRSRLVPIIENPHIDTPDLKVSAARFNVLLRGDNYSSLHWWNKDINSSVIDMTNTPIGIRCQVKGNTVPERLTLLGNADYISEKMSGFNETADFIKTDILHAICRTGEERILLSAEIRHNWDYIVDKISKYKEKLNVL